MEYAPQRGQLQQSSHNEHNTDNSSSFHKHILNNLIVARLRLQNYAATALPAKIWDILQGNVTNGLINPIIFATFAPRNG